MKHYRVSTAEQVTPMEFSDSPSIAITLCRFLFFSLRRSVFKSWEHTSLGRESYNRTLNKLNLETFLAQLTEWHSGLENETLSGWRWGKWRCRIRRVLNMWENYGETASKCLLISFKSSCWTTRIHMSCIERYLPVSTFNFIFIISLIGAPIQRILDLEGDLSS